jgi:hypothetical protein
LGAIKITVTQSHQVEKETHRIKTGSWKGAGVVEAHAE